MKKRLFFLIIPLMFLLSACSWGSKNDPEPIHKNSDQSQEQELVPVPELEMVTDTEESDTDALFSYEYSDLGIKISYPDTCYFNKGIINCEDFTLSIWPLESASQAEVEKSFRAGYTQVEYGFSNNGSNYALMAWYAGENNAEIENAISEISKTLVFTH